MRYVQPEVKLINQIDSRAQAWQFSRPYLDHTAAENEVKEVQAMDLPIGTFVTHHFYMKTSLFFRDLIFTLRPIGNWARSQRTIPFLRENMIVSSEYEVQDEFNRECVDRTMKMIEDKVPQDYAKSHLPMSFVTEFTLSLDDRTLVNFLHSLKIHGRELFDVYGKLILDAIGQDETYLNRKMKDIFPSYALSPEELQAAEEGSFNEHLESIVLASTMGFSLFSQFLRQHYGKVKNDLWNQMETSPLGLGLDCNADVRAVLYTNKTAFDKVISNRICYFAQFDKADKSSWNHILAPVVRQLSGPEFMEKLPCHGDHNKCTIRGDMIPRVKLIEVNPPCPILIQDTMTIEVREMKYQPKSEIFQKWQEIEPLIDQNSENELRKLYLESLHDNHGQDAEGFQILDDANCDQIPF